MTAKKIDPATLEASSWKGHRLAQHREFLALPFAEKIKAVEEMATFSREVSRRNERKRKGEKATVKNA